MIPFAFNLGLEYAHYTDHRGELFQRPQTEEEKKLIDAIIGVIGTARHKEACRSRRQYEEAAALRMRELGMEEQHTMRESLK
jgi:hypothetical protein